MWKRNLIVLLAATLVLVGLTWLAMDTSDIFRDLHSNARDVVGILVVVGLSLAAFVALRGGFWVRTGLVVAVPALYGVLAEFLWSDHEYPGIQVILGGLMAVIALLTCIVVAGPIVLWRKRATRPARSQP
jgi:hypothetical protein